LMAESIQKVLERHRAEISDLFVAGEHRGAEQDARLAIERESQGELIGGAQIFGRFESLLCGVVVGADCLLLRGRYRGSLSFGSSKEEVLEHLRLEVARKRQVRGRHVNAPRTLRRLASRRRVRASMRTFAGDRRRVPPTAESRIARARG